MDNKSFRLKPKLTFYQNRPRFWIGLLCGLGMAIGLFYFQLMLLQCNVYFAREFHNAFIVIPTKQLQWFAGFFGAVGFLGGSSVAFLIWLQGQKAEKRGRKFWLYMAVNDQANVLPSFLYVYIKLAFVILIWFISFQWVYTTNAGLPTILKVFAILLPLALLLNQWINLRRYFEVKPYWIGVHVFILVLTSSGLSFMKLPMEDDLRILFVKERPYLNLNLQYPSITCNDETRGYYHEGLIASNWYIGFDSGQVNLPVTHFHQPHPNFAETSSASSIWGEHALRLFHFDARLPMAAVDSFILGYRKNIIHPFEYHKALIIYNCNNKPDYLALKPSSFLIFRFISCNTRRYPIDTTQKDWIPIKVLNDGQWMLGGEPYTQENLWETLSSAEMKYVMITYEPTTPIEHVLKAYVHFNKLKRPLDWRGYHYYHEKGRKIPNNRFELIMWFVTFEICQ